MKIKFLGAAGTVTGSSYVLTSTSGQSILIDLGMFQGTSEIDKLNYETFDYDCRDLSGAFLTHAHLDHCGRLPIIMSKGFKGNIWMTPPTRDLTELSLLDSAKIAEMNGGDVLYDRDLATKTIRKFVTTNYESQTKVGDFTVTMRDAGHILGSASLEIVDNSANSSIRKIVFSGDLGNTPEELVAATEFIDSADAVVMESTYGDRLHSDTDPVTILQKEVNAIENGGTLLIPAFSLERTQELLHMLKHLTEDKKISTSVPVYLDSPMAYSATKIYQDYPEYFNDHVKKELQSGSPFSFSQLRILRSRKESLALHEDMSPKVIIAGSGMMTGGRIVGHAAHFLTNPTTRLLIVGYQGEETLGRELLEGEKEVDIEGLEVTVAATVVSNQAMSSHADQGQLIDWLKSIKGVKKLFLTHGDDGPRKALSDRIKKDIKITDITLPIQNQEIDLT